MKKVLFILFLLPTIVNAQFNHSRIAPLLEKGNIPGISLALVENGQINTINFGWQNKEKAIPVSNKTIFQAASLSKPVIAVLAMILYQENKLDLDRSLWKYVTYSKIQDVAAAKKITPRMVLSHTSGMPNWGGRFIQLENEPGEKWTYSGEAFVWLALVMEHITDTPLEKLVDEKILAPLKMNNSSFVWRPTEAANVAIAYDEVGQPTSFMKFERPNAAASLWTTAEDYGKFLNAILQKKLLKLFVWKEMLSTQASVPETNKALNWELGLGSEKNRNKKILWHWGDNGPFKAFMLLDTKEQKAFVYFSNSENGLSILESFLGAINYTSDIMVKWLDYPDYSNEKRNNRKEIKRALINSDSLKALSVYKELFTESTEEDQTSLLNNLFYSFKEYKKVDRLLPLFKYHLKLKPNNLIISEKLAETYTLLHEYEKAHKIYNDILSKKTNESIKYKSMIRWLEEGINAKQSKKKFKYPNLYVGKYSLYQIEQRDNRLFLKDLEKGSSVRLSPISDSLFEVNDQVNYRLKFDWKNKYKIDGFAIHSIEGRITYYPKQ